MPNRPTNQRRSADRVPTPLQQVLRSPLSVHGDVAHEAVAFEMDESWHEPQCTAWLAVKNSAQLRSWRSALRKQVKADQSWRDSEHYSRLGGSGIAAVAQATLGVLHGPDEDEDVDDPSRTVYATLDMGAILVDEAEAPVGYATFRAVWLASSGTASSNDLEVEIGEV